MKHKLIEWNGKSQTATEWARELNLNQNSLAYRLRQGWSAERALTTPMLKREIGVCKNHPERPIRSAGLCGSCYNKHIYDKNPELKAKANKRRSRRQAEIRAGRCDKQKLQHSHRQRDRAYKHRYGITIDEYNSILEKQSNKCAPCVEVEHREKSRLYVDHDHDTGKTRALLCPSCNSAMGIIDKGDEFISRCIKYRNKHKKEEL